MDIDGIVHSIRLQTQRPQSRYIAPEEVRLLLQHWSDAAHQETEIALQTSSKVKDSLERPE